MGNYKSIYNHWWEDAILGDRARDMYSCSPTQEGCKSQTTNLLFPFTSLGAQSTLSESLLDECQYFKNIRTRSYQSIAQVPRNTLFGLTATPMWNRIFDLYGYYNLASWPAITVTGSDTILPEGSKALRP